MTYHHTSSLPRLCLYDRTLSTAHALEDPVHTSLASENRSAEFGIQKFGVDEITNFFEFPLCREIQVLEKYMSLLSIQSQHALHVLHMCISGLRIVYYIEIHRAQREAESIRCAKHPRPCLL